MDAANCKRVNVAGSQSATYLQRLLQLKYPGHLAAITLSRVEELLHEHSYTAVDYHEGANDVIVAGDDSTKVEKSTPVNFSEPSPPAEMEKWRSPEFYEREVHRMQLPFSGKLPGGSVSAEEKQERRAQQLRRLQEINARRREEKLLQDQERLDRLMAVQARNKEPPHPHPAPPADPPPLSYFDFIMKVDSLGQGGLTHFCLWSK